MQLRFFDDTADAEEPNDGYRLIHNLARAAEHFVAANILERNWSCSIAAEGLRYDLIAEVGLPRRVQVKMALRPRFRNSERGNIYYHFGQGFGGLRHNGKRRIGDNLSAYKGAIDLFAFVAMDRRSILYVSPTSIPTKTVKIEASEFSKERENFSWAEALRAWGIE